MPLKPKANGPVRCPRCQSVVYSRRNVLCGVCGQKLPAELLFTDQERAVVERQLEKARQKEEPVAPKQPFDPDESFREDHPILGTVLQVLKQGSKGD